MRLPAIFLSLYACLLVSGCVSPSIESPSEPVVAPSRAAVASAHPAATVAGLETLSQGGNAFDAAIAISAALAVAEPYGSGIGGGGYFLLRTAGDPARYRFLDARERAPMAIRPDLFQRDGKIDPQLSISGPLAAAIPGLPAALALLSERFALRSLEDNLVPAIRLAEDGFPVDAIYRQRIGWRLDRLQRDSESARLFLHNGQPPAEGALLRQPELAETLRRLARSGREGFYAGETATKLVAGVRGAGGVWSLQDLRDYQVIEKAPLHMSLADSRELITAPLSSAGGLIVAQSLGILERLQWPRGDAGQQAHDVIEAMRRAYRDRGRLGDPDHVPDPTRSLLSSGHLDALAEEIDDWAATPSDALKSSSGVREGDHTTHFVVIDEQGNAVAATLSINTPFGAAFVPPGTGVLLNNEMDDFSVSVTGTNNYQLVGSPANAVAPGKRPLSSMAPTFIDSGESLTAFGTPGGSRIPSMVLLSILQYMQARPVQDWVSARRYHHQYRPDVVQHEPDAFTEMQKRDLQSRGYVLKDVGRHYGNQQVLRWNKRDGSVEAASDPRGLGITGYLDSNRLSCSEDRCQHE